jgi:hypothetical protein
VGRWDQNGSWGDWIGGGDWIRLAQDRDRCRAVECGDEPSGSCATELVQLVRSSPPEVTVLCYMNPNHIIQPHIPKIHFNIILPPTLIGSFEW